MNSFSYKEEIHRNNLKKILEKEMAKQKQMIAQIERRDMECLNLKVNNQKLVDENK